MPTKLKGLKLTRIDLVDKGANADALVTIFKRDEEEDTDVATDELQAKVAELEAQVAEVTKRAEEAEAKVAELTPPEKTPDPIEKADPEVREAIAKAKAEAAEAKAEVLKMRESAERTEYIAKAAEFKDVMGPADEFGPAYRKIASVLDADELERFEKRLRSMVEVGKTHEIFKEAGSDADAPTGDKYGQMKKDAVAKFPDVSETQAVAKYLDTPEGRKWYESAKEE